MHTTSVSLLERLRQPAAQEAWTRFVELYTPLFFFWARRLGLQEPDAADLVQDLFTTLLETLPQFRYDRQRSFRNWLRTVLLNKWRARCRSFTSQPRQVDPTRLAEAPGPDNVAALSETEFQQWLMTRALQLMQGEFETSTWKACWEHVVCDRPAADIAAELGLSVNAVYLAKSRVLRRLRQELQGMLN